MKALPFLPRLSLFLGVMAAVTGCQPASAPAVDEAVTTEAAATAADDGIPANPGPATPTPVLMWAQTGSDIRRELLREQIHRFNTSQDEIQLNVMFVTAERYSEIVREAALNGELPDLLEFDVPELYRYIWQGYLLPLDDLIPKAIRDDLLPSVIAQGSYEGRLYSVSAAEPGIGLYLNPLKLLNVNTRLPRSIAMAWSAEEFDQLLGDLYEQNGGKPVLDLGLQRGPEWLANVIGPAVLQSAGAGLVDTAGRAASGTLDGEQAVSAMALVQSWFKNGYIDPNEDGEAFTAGRVAFSWSGHWDFPRYDAALNGRLTVVPPPDFGKGVRTGHGGWSWAIPRDANHPEASMAVLLHMLEPKQVLEMASATGAIPSRRSVIGRSSHYGPEMPLHLFARQLEEAYAPRPRSPVLAEMLHYFTDALSDLQNGADVKATLSTAAAEIDKVLADAHGPP